MIAQLINVGCGPLMKGCNSCRFAGAARRWVALVAVSLAAASCASCSGPEPTPEAAASMETARNLVLVTIDTLRADRLGCYGSPSVETPHLDRIASEGAMALQASAPVPLTLPSHASLMTGRLPPEHGLRDNFAPPLPESQPTLAEILKQAGFETAAFVSAVVVSARTSLGRGFETYEDDFEVVGDVRFLNSVQRRGDQTLQQAEEWLDKRDPTRPFFAWIHVYDPHEPYEPPEPFASRYAGRPYDGEVAWSDALMGRLYATLERLDLLQDTLLVVTSDHGEGLGDHEESLHGFFVYQTTLQVPLIVRGPGVRAGNRIEAAVQISDLFPTVLDFLGVAVVPDVSGRNVASAFRGIEPLAEEAIYAESLIPRLHFGWSELRTLREGRFKFIEAPRPELYDLVADPGELHNLVGEKKAQAKTMREALLREIDRLEGMAPSTDPAESVPSEEVRRQLGALGYLGAGGGGSNPGADPKDKVEEFRLANRLIRDALVRLQAGDPHESVELFERLLARGIQSYEVHYYMGRALLELSRFSDAQPHLEAAQRLQPHAAEVYGSLADCYAARRDIEGALGILQQGRRAVPDDPGLPRQEALLRVRIGEVYRDKHNLEEAAQQLRLAVNLDPAPAEYWNSLATILGAASHWEESAIAFRHAIERNPSNHLYVYNLGLVLFRSGRHDEAARQFRRALELKPDFQAAKDRLDEIASAARSATSHR